MGKSKRRQSTSALSSKGASKMSEEITDDDIYAAFGVTKDDGSDDLQLDTSTPRQRSKKKVKKRQSAPVKRMSIYDVLYEDEEKYEIPKGVFDSPQASPQANEKRLKRPKSTSQPVEESKIPTIDAGTSIFDMLITPRETKEKYGKKKKKVKSKELVADLGTPTVDDQDEETPQPPSEPLPVVDNALVSVRPISMTKRRKESSKKVRSNSLLIDLGEPPKTVATSPADALSASDSQLVLNDEYLNIKSSSTPTTTRREKKTKKVRSESLLIDLGEPPMAVAEIAKETASSDFATFPDYKPLHITPNSMTKRGKKSKKIKSNSLTMDLGNPIVEKASGPKSLSASDSQLCLEDHLLEVKSSPSSTPTVRRRKKSKPIRSDSLLVDLGEPPMSVAEASDSSSSSDVVASSGNETLHITPSSMTKRGKKSKKIKSKSFTMDLGNPIVEKESPESLSASDSQLCIDNDILGVNSSGTPKRKKKNKPIRSDSLLIDLGEPPMAVAEDSDSSSSESIASPGNEALVDVTQSSMTKRSKKAKKTKSKSLTMDLGNPIVKNESTELLQRTDAVLPLNDESFEVNLSQRTTRDEMDQEILPRRRCRSHSPHARKSMIHWGMTELHVIEESSEEEDDDRWSTHSSDSPPHVPRKRRKRHKSCTPPLARSPNRLWLDSFEVSVEENKTKKKKKKRKSKEKSSKKSSAATKKSSERHADDSDTSSTEEFEKPSSMKSLNSNASSTDSSKGNPKKKHRSITREPSMDSTIEDSVEEPSSKHSRSSNASSKSSKKESPKKKRKSNRKSSSKWEPSLHDSMEIAAAVAAAEEAAMRETAAAKRKVEEEHAKLRAEEEARRNAEQEAASARLRLKVVEVQRKIEEEDQLRAMRDAERQADEGVIERAQEEARRNAEMVEECKRLKAEQERLQQERAEIQRLKSAEQERLEKERAELQRQKDEEAERLAKERAGLERQRLEEEQRLQREQEKQECELMEEKARIKAEQEAKKARLMAEKQEHERLAKEEKLRLKAEKQERDRRAKEEKARIKAEKDAELARIKAEKEAEKSRIKAEKEAEKERIRSEKLERERMAAEEKARLEAEKQAELKRQEEAAAQKAEEERTLKLKKPSIVDRNYSIDSLFQGSIDNSLHAESEAERLIRERKELDREIANLERQKNAAKARLQRRAEAIRAAVMAEKAKVANLDLEMHNSKEFSEEEEERQSPRRRKQVVAVEKRERTPFPETGEEAKQRAKKEAWVRKQEKRRRSEEQAAEDYRLGKLNGRRSISKNNRQFGSSWSKVSVSS